MFKKFLSLCLCLFCTTTFANTKSEFKNALNSLTYELTVEWDQKDKTVFDSVMDHFQFTVAQLKAKGLTTAEIKDVISKMVRDPKLHAQLELQTSLLNLDNDKSIGDYVWAKKADFYSSGASWNGEVLQVTGFFVIAAAFLAFWLYQVINPKQYVCTQQSSYYCETRQGCDSYYTDVSGDSQCDSYSDYEWCGTECVAGYEARKY